MKLIEALKKWSPWILGVIVICLTPFLGYLLSDKSLYASDQISSIAWNVLLDWVHKGIFPLWQPYQLGGMPTVDAITGDLIYPPFLLASFLFPVQRLVGNLLVLHLVWGGLGAFFLARKGYKINSWICLALAVMYAFNSNAFTLIYGGHTGKYYVLSWLPWVFYFLRRSLQPRARWYHLLGLAAGIWTFIHTSHLQFTYFVLIGFFLYWLSTVIVAFNSKSIKEWILLFPKFWIPIVLGVGMAFYVFFPPMKYNKEFSVRGTAEKMSMEHATSWAAHPEEIASLVVPEFGGFLESYWGRNYFKLNSEYPGLAVLGFGLSALILLRRRKDLWVWGGVLILAVVFSLGEHTPVFQLFFNYVPGIKNFRAPSMMLFWFFFALFILCLNLFSTSEEEHSWGEHQTKKYWKWAGGSAGILFVLGLFAPATYEFWISLFGGTAWENMANYAKAIDGFRIGSIRAAVIWVGLWFTYSQYRSGKWSASSFGKALLVLAVLDLWIVDFKFIQTYDAQAMYPPFGVLSQIKEQPGNMRVFALPGVLQRAHLQYAGIEGIDGFVDNELKYFNDFRGGDHQRNPYFFENLKQYPDGTVGGNAFLDLLSVKYLIYGDPRTRQVGAALNMSVLPRAFFSSRYTFAGDTETYQALRQVGAQPKDLIYISKDEQNSMPKCTDTSLVFAAVDVAKYEPNHQTLKVKAPKAGIVMISQTYFPHWQVSIDGKPSKLLRTFGALSGVYVTQGDHQIELVYRSPWIVMGQKVAAVSLLALILFLLGYEWTTRKSRSVSSATPVV